MKIFYISGQFILFWFVINHQIGIKFNDCFAKDKVLDFLFFIFEEPIIYIVSPWLNSKE
jgi:hypothetical protein